MLELNRVIVAALLAVLVACAGAPVQEMSDARQAVRAAQAAGAGDLAPEPLAEAQRLIEEAQSMLQRHDYRGAQAAALDARRAAVEALDAARRARDSTP